MFEMYRPADEKTQADMAADQDALPKHMVLDGMTLRNLEIFENSADGTTSGTLYGALNKCVTPFGKRLLRQWLCSPLCCPEAIKARQDAIYDLRGMPQLTAEVSLKF